jgi:cation transport ATPase
LKAEIPAEAAAPARYRREKEEKEEKAEKAEKREKEEKWERAEKHEKREVAAIGPLIGGLFLIFLGSMFYLQVLGYRLWEFAWAFFLIIVGVIIIAGVLWARRVFPKP